MPTGTLTIGSGAGTVSASTITLSNGGSNVSILNLNGGVLLLGSGGMPFSSFNANAALNFNGGTLKSSAPITITTGGLPINILAGGATIDSSGGNITFGSGLAYQAGSGNLTIQGGNTVTASVGATVEMGAVTVTGNGTKFTLNSASGTTSAGSLTINTGATLDMGNNTFTTGGLTGVGTLTNSSSTSKVFTITGNGSYNFSGNITGTTALTVNMTGAGMQTLSGNNTYSGLTTLSAGTLNINGEGAVGGANYSGMTFNGGTLQYANPLPGTNGSGDVTQNLGGTAKPVTISASGATVDTNGNAITYASPLGNSGNGNLTIADSQGTGSLTLLAAASYTGLTKINSGATLQLGDGATGHDGTIATSSGITNNGTLIYNRFGSLTSSVPISGSGSVVKLGNGNQTLTAANSYTGGTVISAGTLQGTGTALSTGNVTLAGGNIAVNDGVTTAAGNLTTGSHTWNGNSSYTARVFSTGSADKIIMSAGNSTLDVSSVSASSPFTVHASAAVGSLDPAVNQDWVIASFTNLTGVTNPTAGNATVVAQAGVNTTAFILDLPTNLFSGNTYGSQGAPLLEFEAVNGGGIQLGRGLQRHPRARYDAIGSLRRSPGAERSSSATKGSRELKLATHPFSCSRRACSPICVRRRACSPATRSDKSAASAVGSRRTL